MRTRDDSTPSGWHRHEIRQGDGRGGWVSRQALRQVLRHPDCEYTMPFGLAQMDTGEIAIVVSREKADPAGGRIIEPNIAFSRDGGATWSSFRAIAGTRGRPQFLTWLGGGGLSFVTEALGGGQQQRFFSSDYGRTWTESVDHPGTREGRGFGMEGNGWVDRDQEGAPRAILEIGYHLDAGKTHPTGDFTGVFRRSVDGGRTWIDEVAPPQWKFTVEHQGRTWLRGVSEGAVVRAANGDLVAALRTDMPPVYFDGPHDDSLAGTAISISTDDGRTWSDLQFLFDAGRHHANLQRLPSGDLVCTLVVRDDIQAGELTASALTSHRRGCDALVSHDHGRTWNLDRRYELDCFEFLRADGYWVDGVCGHVGAVVLDDGRMLAVYGNYRLGAVLIKWDPGAAEEEAAFFVSPAGRDEHPGTLEKPFQTLARARDAVRALKAQSPGRPITVLVRGGTYDLDRSVVFTGRDSGTAEGPITYQAYPGEQPVFRGSRAITGWQPHRDGIYRAELPQTENQYWRFRELFCNGVRQVRARWPNHDPADAHFGGWAFIEATVPADATAATSFRCEPGVFPRTWAKPEQGEVFIIPGLAWNSNLLPIRACDPATRTITVDRRLSQVWDRLMAGNRFYVENLLEELDQPGEWCFDTETQTVYFMPPGGTMEGTEVTVPVTDRLIELRATTGESVRHLRFRGLAFTQTLSVFPHFHPLHPDYVDCNRPNSGGYAVYLENAEHCAIEGCTFDQVGGDAIRLHGYSGHNRIVGNQIAGAGAQGICLADLDLWPYDVPPVWRDNEQALREVSARLPWAVGNLISQNHIHHCGAIDRFGAAIRLHGLNTDGNVISHNHVHDQPHHGIYLSTGFGQNIIEYNDLHALCRSLADAGGVYSNRWCLLEDDPVLGLGHVIRYNRIRDVMGVHPHARPAADPAATPSPDRIVRPHMTWGIYFDNSPRRALVHGNLCIGNTWGGVFLGGGYAEPEACVVENNLFVDSSIYQFDVVLGAHARDNCFRRNIVCYRNPDAALMRAGRAWKDGAASYAGWREFDRNLYWQAAGAPLRIPDLAEGTLDDWRALAFDRNSLVADPLFVDPAGGDYRLRPDSPALALGFAPLPVELMGITEETADMAAARAEAARRRRRLIYNDDGCGPIMQPGGGTREGFLRGPHSRLRAVAGSQVDSVFICSGASHVLNHRSAVAESYADVAERYGIGGEWELFRANLRALEALDTDPVQLTVDFCRDQGLEVVYSHRINDIHSQFLEVERSTWFREHPEYWINTPEDAAQAGGVNSPRHWWSALDFEQPAVLDYLVCVQQDVCGRYDVDGVETDYFRSPLFFRPNLDFRPATSAQLEILTQFQRRLQAVHRRAGAARGRPVLTIARVPATVATCCHVGIDIECWLHQGLLDVLTVGGGYLPFTEPLDELVALARTAGVPLYATISTSGMRGPENRYGTHEAWRGAAANMWHRGVDGIVTFNLFPSEPDPRFRDLGSVRTLAGQDKLFAIDCTRVLEGDLVQGIAQSQALPLAVPADGSAARAVLPVGDDLHAAHAAGTLATVELRVHLADPAAAAIVEVHLNGTPLAPAAPLAEGWLAFRPQAGWFRAGANELHFRAAARTAVPGALLTEVLHVELEVRYRGPAAARG